MNWASGLNGSGVLTYNINPGLTVTWGGDWRLPETNPATPYLMYGTNGLTSAGYNITTSELGHLFYTELGNMGLVGIDGSTNDMTGVVLKRGPFTSLWHGGYWSGTEYAPNPDYVAWKFYFQSGYQFNELKNDEVFYGLAVRPGDVAALAPVPVSAPVPEPGTMMLMGSGIVGLVAARKRLFRRNR